MADAHNDTHAANRAGSSRNGLMLGMLALLVLLFLPGVALSVPPDTRLDYAGGELGPVVLDGTVHADQDYVCATCHKGKLAITKSQSPKTLADHFADVTCFKCHNNEAASRECMTCHRRTPDQEAPGTLRQAVQAGPLDATADVKPLLEGGQGALAQTRACLSCHARGDLAPVSERGKTLRLTVNTTALAEGTHSNLACTTCHAGSAGKDSFTQVPHALHSATNLTCLSCHSTSLAAPIARFKESIHYARLKDNITCTACHDTHTVSRDAAKKPYLLAVADMNGRCLACHADSAKLKSLSGKDQPTAASSHAFMSGWEAHLRTTMCVECHVAANRGHDGTGSEHVILSKDAALRDCAVCHSQGASLILQHAAAYTDGATAFTKSYMPGRSPDSQWLGSLGAGVFLLVLLIAAHALGRYVCTRGHTVAVPAHRVFVYPGFVRVSHWINALLFLTLFYTGFAIHAPEAFWSLDLGTATTVHDAAGILLLLNYAVFLAVSVTTGDIRQYLPCPQGLFGRLFAQARYYLYGIFKGEKHPFATTRESRFNPLQQITYLVVYIVGMPLLLLSGLLLLVPDLAAGLDRSCLARIHFGIAILYGIFLVVHVYLATTGHRVSSLFKGMINGHHEE